MKFIINVYGQKIKDENDTFSFSFILLGKYTLDELKDKHGFIKILRKEISSRLKYDFIILDYDVTPYFEVSHEKL